MLGKQVKALFGMVKDIQRDIQELKQTIQPSTTQETVAPLIDTKPFISGRNEEYWYVGYDGDIYCRRNADHKRDTYKISVGNCFRTKQAAQKYKDFILMGRKLQILGDELNDKVPRDPNTIHKIPMYTLALQEDFAVVKVVSCRIPTNLINSSTILIKSKYEGFAEAAIAEFGYEALLDFLSYGE